MNEKLIDLILKIFSIESIEDFCTIIIKLVEDQTETIVGFRIHIYDKNNDKYFLFFDSDNNKLHWFENECKLSDVKYFSKIVIDTKEELVIQDSHSKFALNIDPRLNMIYKHSMAWFPLKYKNNFLGIISFGGVDAKGFSEETLKFIRIVSQILTIKVHEFFSSENKTNKIINNIYQAYSHKLYEQMTIIHGNLQLLSNIIETDESTGCTHGMKCSKYVNNLIKSNSEALKLIDNIKNSLEVKKF